MGHKTFKNRAGPLRGVAVKSGTAKTLGDDCCCTMAVVTKYSRIKKSKEMIQTNSISVLPLGVAHSGFRNRRNRVLLESGLDIILKIHYKRLKIWIESCQKNPQLEKFRFFFPNKIEIKTKLRARFYVARYFTHIRSIFVISFLRYGTHEIHSVICCLLCR